MKRVLITGARGWTDYGAIERVLWDLHVRLGTCTLVHGNADGADLIADAAADRYVWNTEAHPWQAYGTPRDRNQHMVDLGADVCLVFAQSWASGSGMCARMARRAGIPTVDYGVRTALEDR